VSRFSRRPSDLDADARDVLALLAHLDQLADQAHDLDPLDPYVIETTIVYPSDPFTCQAWR
jgi:hypothetical protein